MPNERPRPKNQKETVDRLMELEDTVDQLLEHNVHLFKRVCAIEEADEIEFAMDALTSKNDKKEIV